MKSDEMLNLVLETLEENKGKDITSINVKNKTAITDYMVIVTGTSVRHLKALSNRVSDKLKEQGEVPLGLEGAGSTDWILLDLGDVIVHFMVKQARDFYQIEKLWDPDFVDESIV